MGCNTEILFEYLKDHSDKKIEKYYVDIRDIIAENVCNGVFDCDNAYLYGYKLQGREHILEEIRRDMECYFTRKLISSNTAYEGYKYHYYHIYCDDIFPNGEEVYYNAATGNSPFLEKK